jgi:hypothetical protein
MDRASPGGLRWADAGALAALGIVAIIYTWPLLSSAARSMPGGPTDRDVATMVWTVGWVAHALRSGESVLHTDEVLVPFGADLRLHTYGLVQGALATPLVPLVGVVGAFNVMLVGTTWLNGAALYGLSWQVTRSRAAALVGGVCFMLASPLLDQLRVGRPTFASLWITVAALLLVRQLLIGPRLWHGAALGVVLAAALFTDFQILLFTALWLAIYGSARVRIRHAAALAVAGGMVAVPFVLIFLPALTADDYPRPRLLDTQEYSFRIWDYLDPAVAAHAYGIELGFAALAALAARRVSVWLIGGVLFLILALGPYLQPTDLPLPFAAFSAWAPLAQFRTPYRLAMPAVLGLSMVLATVLAAILARWRASIRIGVVGVLVLARLAVAVLHDPLQVQVYPAYATYERIAREPGRFTILEVPFGVRSGLEQIGNGGEVLEYYQHVHGKPLLNGMIARLPRGVFETYRAQPALLLLAGEPVTASADDLAVVLRWTNSRYVVVHSDMLNPQALQRVLALLDGQPGLERLASDGALEVYRAILSAG